LIVLMRRAGFVLVALLALAVPLVAGAQDRGCELHTAGNDYYTIYMYAEQATGGRGPQACPIGAYGVLTGPDHPAGPGLQVLQDGDTPRTSFNSVRSYTGGTDYLLSNASTLQGTADRGFTTMSVAHLGFTEEVDEQTLRASFYLSPPNAPDTLTIRVEVSAEGTTFDDAAVRVTTTIDNFLPPTLGGQAIHVAIRYLWDFAVDTVFGPDNGPSLRVGSTTSDFETDLLPVEIAEESYEMLANPSFYTALGTLSGPAHLDPTVPDRAQYVCAPWAAGVVYDYVVSAHEVANQDLDCSPDPTGDSGFTYYFETGQGAVEDFSRGIDEGIEIPAGGTYSVSAYIFTESTVEPELCFTIELDATQTSNDLGIPNLQNNDVVCGTGVLEEPEIEPAARGDEDPFELFFDGSDVGITRTIIDGMDVQDTRVTTSGRGEEKQPADVLLSFNQAHSIPPIGLALQSDIVRFVADENGTQTAGAFERFFDGSDIGLAAAGEDIDAFVFDDHFNASRKPDTLGDLYFSTSGNLNVPGLSAQDEDIVVCYGYDFEPGQGGDIVSSCEALVLFFDGTAAGLANASEDVDAFAFAPSVGRSASYFGPDLYLSTRGNFSLEGVNGRNEDVFSCHPIGAPPADRAAPMAVTGCASVAIVFDGSDYGLRSNNVYSIDVREQNLCFPVADRGFCEASREQ
jgi:hypothetical protein